MQLHFSRFLYPIEQYHSGDTFDEKTQKAKGKIDIASKFAS